MRRLGPRARLVGTLLWLVMIGALTLTPAPDQVARVAETPWTCLACGDGSSTDILLNLALFAPLGLLLGAQAWRWLRVALLACVISATIEIVQGNLLAGRDASLSDVLANTLGAIIGWHAVPVLHQAARPTRRFAASATGLLLVITTLLWLGTGIGLKPSLSQHRPWVGQPLRVWAGHDPFRGRFVEASFDGIGVEDDPLASVPPHPDSLDVALVVTSADTTPPARKVSLLRIVDGKGKSQLSLTARGGDLLVDFPLRSSRWGFRTPTWSFHDAARIPLATPWRWQVVREPRSIALHSGATGGTAAAERLPLSVGLGWALIHPFAPPVDEQARWWTVLWLASWMAALGWFAGVQGTRVCVGAGGVAIVAFVLTSLATGLPVHAIEIVALLIGYLPLCLLGARTDRVNTKRGATVPAG
ncbi:MAG: VanZ family protein [Gemmatimonadota bacterium]